VLDLVDAGACIARSRIAAFLRNGSFDGRLLVVPAFSIVPTIRDRAFGWPSFGRNVVSGIGARRGLTGVVAVAMHERHGAERKQSAAKGKASRDRSHLRFLGLRSGLSRAKRGTLGWPVIKTATRT